MLITIIHSIFWYISATLSLIGYTPQLLWMKSRAGTMNPHEFNRLVHSIASRWATSNVRRSFAKFHVQGIENIPQNEATLFVSNHQGNFDIAVFLAYLPVPHGYVAKIEILKIPLLRAWMVHMRCIFIDRKNMRKSAKALLDGIKILQNGQSLVLFPEGTRSKSQTLGEFKAASFKLATKAAVPIVPVSIDGTYLMMEANRGLIKPTDVYVKFHPPIRPEEFEDDTKDLSDRVKQIIQKGITKDQNRV